MHWFEIYINNFQELIIFKFSLNKRNKKIINHIIYVSIILLLIFYNLHTLVD